MERVQLWALCSLKGLSDGAKRTFLLLLCHSFGKGECWPGKPRLARLAGCEPDTIKKHLRELKNTGLIEPFKEGPVGKPVTKYRITFTKERALEILAASSWALLFTCGIALLEENLEVRGRGKVRIPKPFLMSFPDLGAGALITFIMLWSLHQVVLGRLDNRKIGQLRGLKERAVEYHLAESQDLGVLDQEERRDARGHRLPSRIVFRLPGLERCLRVSWGKEPARDGGVKPQVEPKRKIIPKLYIRRLEGEYVLKFVFLDSYVTLGGEALKNGKRGAKAPGRKREISLEPGDEERYCHMARDVCVRLGDEKSYGYFLLVCKACQELDGNYDMLFHTLGLTREVKSHLRSPGAYFAKVMNNRLEERGVELVAVAEAKRRRKERAP